MKYKKMICSQCGKTELTDTWRTLCYHCIQMELLKDWKSCDDRKKHKKPICRCSKCRTKFLSDNSLFQCGFCHKDHPIKV